MIIIDTREKKPLWNPKEYTVKKMKLDEGDYTTEKLFEVAHIERKSPIDLYGSIIQNHDRFVSEINRANNKQLKFAIFVECPSEMFFKKRFARGNQLLVPEMSLRKIISTMKDKYGLEFVWCKDREDLRDKMCIWFANEERTLEKKEKLKTLEDEQKNRKQMIKFKE